MEPTIKKIRQSTPYLVNQEVNGIFGFYQILVKWPDGTKKYFNSEEEANAFVEKRAVNKAAIANEVPDGFDEAQQQLLRRRRLDEEEEEEPEQTEFNVILMGFGDKKISVIKAVRILTGFGLKESKALVESLPTTIQEHLSKDNAEAVRAELELAGAQVELR